MTSRFTAGLWAVLALLVAGEPARAADGFEPVGDIGYALEFDQWTPEAASVKGFGALMHTVVMADRSGVVLAGLTSMAKTNANRSNAEQAAIRRGESSYHYEQHIDEPQEGVRLGLVLGTGSPVGFAQVAGGEEPAAKLARLQFDGDLLRVGPGTLAFHTGLTYFQASAAGLDFQSFGAPLGLTYRLAPLLPALVFEPFADFDWLQAFGRSLCYDLGLRAAYYVHPRVALTARVELGRWGAGTGAFAGQKTGAVGASLIF